MIEKPEPGSVVLLEFRGPFRLCGTEGRVLFDQEEAQLDGIYLWAVQFRQGFLVNYVGETGVSFHRRMKDHMIQCMGGNYRVCDVDWLLRGEKRILWNGMWRKGTQSLMPVFVEKYVELAPKIKAYLEVLGVFVAPIQVNRRIRRRIEGAMALSLRRKPAPVGAFITEDVRYYGRKDDETPIQVVVNSDAKLLGLDNRITA